MSGLCDYLLDVLPMFKDENSEDVHLSLYGDATFKPNNVIMRRIENEDTEPKKLLNSYLNCCRTMVEMMFGDSFKLFKLLGIFVFIK